MHMKQYKSLSFSLLFILLLVSIVMSTSLGGVTIPFQETVLVLVGLNPEFIFTTAWDPSGNEPAFVTEWKNDPALANVDAIKNGHVYVLDSANVTTASHYVIEGAEDLFDILSKN